MTRLTEWAHRPARVLPHVAWRDRKIAELRATSKATSEELRAAEQALADARMPEVGVPSLRHYVAAARRIEKHMQRRNYPDRGNIVTRKLKSYSFAQSHGVSIPQIHGIWDDPDEIAWDDLPDRVVIKSNIGTFGQGVFPLHRVIGGWSRVTTDGTLTSAEIVRMLREISARGRVRGPYFAEELLEGGAGDALPVDVKVLSFYGEVGLVYIRSVPSFTDNETWRYRMFLPDGSDAGDVYRSHRYDEDLPRPPGFDEVLEVASRLSAAIPAPLTRVDLYDIGGRIVFGELTPRPGGALDFGPDLDRDLGHFWERAESRVASDVLDGMDYLLKFGPSSRELQAGDRLVLPSS